MESVAFGTLFFILPFIFYPNSSEIFELNKIVVLYLFAILIIAVYLIRSRKMVKSKSKIYLALLFFLLSQSLSTLFSVDLQISIFGYYGRFNGGVLSLFAYSALFFVYANSQTKHDVKKHLKAISISAALVSVIAILEHFNISITCFILRGETTTYCWSQNLQERAFATFGQPNWLAAFLAISLPFSTPILMPIIFLAVLMTRSRSGLLGFSAAYLITWFPKIKNNSSSFAIITLILALLFSIFNPLRNITNQAFLDNPQTNITPSSKIRELIWYGAINAWKQKPLLGWGPETFAIAYQSVRLPEHNLTSEWNFIYNKAHNEYLNYLTTTGIIGLGSYLLFIIASLYEMLKLRPQISNLKVILLASFISILITNFFGFSTVITNLYLFILPAMAIATNRKSKITKNMPRINIKNLFIIIATSYTSISVINFWRADYFYAQALRLQEPFYIDKAIKLYPHTDLYKYEKIYLNALVNKNAPKKNLLKTNNYKHLEIVFNTYLTLSETNNKYINFAIEAANALTVLSPNYAKYYYLRGLAYLRAGNHLAAQKSFEQALSLKPNYKKAAILLNSINN